MTQNYTITSSGSHGASYINPETELMTVGHREVWSGDDFNKALKEIVSLSKSGYEGLSLHGPGLGDGWDWMTAKQYLQEVSA